MERIASNPDEWPLIVSLFQRSETNGVSHNRGPDLYHDAQRLQGLLEGNGTLTDRRNRRAQTPPPPINNPDSPPSAEDQEVSALATLAERDIVTTIESAERPLIIYFTAEDCHPSAKLSTGHGKEPLVRNKIHYDG